VENLKLKDTSNNELEKIIKRLHKNNIPCKMLTKDGKIISLETKDKELLEYGKKSNPDLK